jgi:hypothetical protein
MIEYIRLFPDMLGYDRVYCQRSFNLVVGGCQRHSSGRRFDPRLGVKKIPLANSTQSTWSRPGQSSWAIGPCVRVGKAHVPKHKVRTGPWVILFGDGPLCMGGCGVRGVFLAYVRRLLLNIKPWGRSFPYNPCVWVDAGFVEFFYDRVYWAIFIYGRIPPDMLD